jgi:hypothetical protein
MAPLSLSPRQSLVQLRPTFGYLDLGQGRHIAPLAVFHERISPYCHQ